GGAPLARSRVVLLSVQSAGEPADEEAYGDHDRERRRVSRVRDGKRKEGSDEEEVVGGDGEKRGRERGPAAEADGGDDDGEQVKDDRVREAQRELPIDGADRRERGEADRPEIGCRKSLFRRLAHERRLRPLVPEDHVDFELAAPADDFVDERSAEDVAEA